MPGERMRDYHVSLRGFLKHLWIYVVLFLCVLPAVLYASTTTAFRHTYPFYRLANRSTFDLWGWECLYAAQFLSLEFFFRGFILKALRRAARLERDLRDDRAVLHDPLRQAAARRRSARSAPA